MNETFRDAIHGRHESSGKTWRERAESAIQEACLVWLDMTRIPINRRMTEAQRRKFIKVVDGHYPFGPRKHFPYKAWLAVRAELLMQITPELPVDSGLFEVTP